MADRGMAALVGELIDQDDEADAEDAQLGLFAPPATDGGLRKAKARGWSGVGRKPGARNKRTQRSVAFILSRHRNPLVVLAEMAEANVFDLAAMLGCTPLQAYQEKRLAAIGLLPYVAARITPEVLQDNVQVVHLTINQGGAGAVTGEGSGAVATILENVQFQRISDNGANDL